MTTPAAPPPSSPSTNPDPRSEFSGVFTALVTPFRDDGAVDEQGLRRLVRRQIAGGVAGLVPCGTTGEAVTLDPDEHERVVAISVEEARAADRDAVLAMAGRHDGAGGVEVVRAWWRAAPHSVQVVR
ncbi:MAG TPA: dihydrodipicolinate synthase family protein, partial [Thermoanaerobaculia bacterium]|nr:dihydrodipicolinate synthase family protein [Thermoanaerobaculia bacterium]